MSQDPLTVAPPLNAASEAFGASDYADMVGARLLEFFLVTAPWQRRLWDVGTCLSLKEVIEASHWRGRGVLSDGSLTWLAQDVSRIVGRDPGTGESVIKKHLNEVLKTSLGDGTRHLRRLQELSEMAADGYMSRWLETLKRAARPSIERTSRAIASHLLDRGFSMAYLRRWTQEHIKRGSTLEDLMLDAIALSEQPARDFIVVVPFHAVPGSYTKLTAAEPTWRTATQVSTWLAQNRSAATGIRQSGGFQYTVRAHDPIGAVLRATEKIDRLISRATLARGHTVPPQPLGDVWVEGWPDPFELDRTSRGAYALSMIAESRLYDVTTRSDLDDALELAAVLNRGLPGPAIASGWAAIEALLVSSRDGEDAKTGRGAVAADRLASLVACSWPRAELTALSYKHRLSVADSLSSRLTSAVSNKERSAVVANALAGGKSLALRDWADRAAESRMRNLVAAERTTLKDVESHVRSAMRRLYRQRNIVMHGGSTETLARDAALRTCAPLVGAGLDRIAHARISDGETALQLADRARLRLDLVGNAGGPHITDLLG